MMAEDSYLPESARLRTAEATPGDVKTMEQYIAARRRGFGKRIAPVPPTKAQVAVAPVSGKRRITLDE